MNTIASDVPSDEKSNGRWESIAQRWDVRVFLLFQYQVVRKEPRVAENSPQCDWNGGGGCPLALSLERGWGPQPSLEPLAPLRQCPEARPGSEECGWSFHQHVLVYDAPLQLGCEMLASGRCGPGTSRLH